MTQNYEPAYPPEFRQQMVELVALGKSPKQLSKEFGCHYPSIQAWCWAARVPIRSSQAIAPVSILSGAPLNASQRAIANCRLTGQIMTIYRTSDCAYGRPRITVELADLGIRVNHKRVGGLMREAGILRG